MPIVIVEGNIGAGKSTLLRSLEKSKFVEFEHVVVQEPVDAWQQLKDGSGRSIFEKFYEDRKKYAFVFQTFILTTQVQNIIKAVTEHPDKVIFCERSFFTGKHVFARGLYENGTFEEIEWMVYNHLFDFMTSELKVHIDGIMYLRAEPAECLQRVGKRGRPEETSITEDFLSKLHDVHDEWIGNSKHRCLVIDGNKNMNDSAHWTGVNSSIATFVGKISRNSSKCTMNGNVV